MKVKILTLALFTCFTAPSVSFAVKDDFFETTRFEELSIENIPEISKQAMQVSVRVLNDEKNPLEWQLNPTDWPILLSMIEKAEAKKPELDHLTIPQPSAAYKGLEVTITDRFGDKLKPFRIFNGAVRSQEGDVYTTDPDREVEYWTWGTYRSNRVLDTGWKMMPVTNFNQCIHMGNRLIHTSPRQCLMTNGDIFLDIAEKPTQESVNIKNFDDCLHYGQALINTFPRRCIAAGGHVYTEPPRVD